MSTIHPACLSRCASFHSTYTPLLPFSLLVYSGLAYEVSTHWNLFSLCPTNSHLSLSSWLACQIWYHLLLEGFLNSRVHVRCFFYMFHSTPCFSYRSLCVRLMTIFEVLIWMRELLGQLLFIKMLPHPFLPVEVVPSLSPTTVLLSTN